MYRGKVIGFIDIGTNAVRLLVVRIKPNLSYSILRKEREVVRLGDEEFSDNSMLHPQAIRRTVIVCKRLAELSKSYGAKKIFVVATSAAREAKNQAQFISKLKREAGIEVNVISGREEARMIYLGVSSGAQIGDKKAVFIDVGGGSTEVVIGNQHNFDYLESIEVGTLRMKCMFEKELGSGPVTNKVYDKMKLQAKNTMLHVLQMIKEVKPDLAFGSSGTIVNLAEISAISAGKKRNHELVIEYKNLRNVASRLRKLELKNRRNFPGINPDRADIIIGGAAIIEAFMEGTGIDKIIASERGLIYGMLFNYLSGDKKFPALLDMPIRERSVLQLGRSSVINENHANHVVSLSMQLFDSAKKAGFHNFGAREKELLRYAAFLHDAGDSIAFRNHQMHSCYLIKNVEMLGFDESEINLMANIARYHGKKQPKRKELLAEKMDVATQRAVVVLSEILRLAENLDRCHKGVIKKVSLSAGSVKGAVLHIEAAGESELELWSARSNARAFEKVFGKTLSVRTDKEESPD